MCLMFSIPWSHGKDFGIWFWTQWLRFHTLIIQSSGKRVFFLLVWSKFWSLILTGHWNILVGGTEQCWLARRQSGANSWTNHLGQESVNHSARTACLLLLIKFYCNTARSVHLECCLWLLWCCSGRAAWWLQRPQGPGSLKCLLSGYLQKSLPTPRPGIYSFALAVRTES